MKRSELRQIIKEEIKKVSNEGLADRAFELEWGNWANFNTGWDVIGYLDDIPELKKYRNKAASYDDEYYLIPTDVFTQVTGWTEEDVRNINDNLEPYEGNIIWTNTNPNQYQEYTVSVSGGA